MSACARGFGGGGRIAVLAGVASLLMAACGGGGGRGTVVLGGGHDAPAPRVTITPRDGAAKARPDLGVVVKVAGGTLGDVVVSSKPGNRVPGVLSPDGTSWRTWWTLAPGTLYLVRASATSPEGVTTRASSRFTTLQPSQTIAISDVTPSPGETVGVGMPIMVDFDRAVFNKDRVERALVVRSDRPVLGAWRWVSDQQVVFRTSKYWRPHQQVTFTAHLAGVRAARDVYGTQDSTQRFKIGDANLSVVNVKAHRMVVTRNGARVRDVGISAGRAGARKFITTNGVHAVMGKYDPVVMTSGWMGITDPADPGYYKLTVYDAVQISSSGEYVHSAPWSVWAQGSLNVSHGCINASPAFAAWFYAISQRGDIVTVTGTDRELEWDNGYGYWQLPWQQWLQGSALKRPVTTAQAQAPAAAARSAGRVPARG